MTGGHNFLSPDRLGHVHGEASPTVADRTSGTLRAEGKRVLLGKCGWNSWQQSPQLGRQLVRRRMLLLQHDGVCRPQA